jgi:hypothetical protein
VVGDRSVGGAAPPVSLLTGGRRSPEGEHATIKRVCGGSLSRVPRAQT